MQGSNDSDRTYSLDGSRIGIIKFSTVHPVEAEPVNLCVTCTDVPPTNDDYDR